MHVRYVLKGSPSSTVSLDCTYSIDGGNTFQAATEVTGGVSEGTSGLASSPAGTFHFFVWDSGRDTGSTQNQDLIFRIIATDGALTDRDQTPGFDTAVGLASSVQILRVYANRTDPHVLVRYSLTDAQSSLTRIAVHYSQDAGQTWSPAAEAAGVGSEGVIGLAAGTSPCRHTFAWNAAQDLQQPQALGLLLRITSLDTRAGGSDTSRPFDFGVNSVPEVEFVAPRGGTHRSPTMVRCLIKDADSDPADLSLQYSVDGGLSFQRATPAVASWGTATWTQLATSPDGDVYLLPWDSAADVGPRRSGVILRASAKDTAPGLPVSSLPFDIDSSASPFWVQILNPVSGIFGSPTLVRYELIGPGPFSVRLLYSIDNGGSFHLATHDPSISDPLTGLTGGQPYLVYWMADQNLAVPRQDDILLKIEATDAQGNVQEAIAGPIDVEMNLLTQAMIQSPLGGARAVSPVPIRYLLMDRENDFVDVDVKYSTDGGISFRDAREAPLAPGHEGRQNLSSSFSGDPHLFMWDAAADLGAPTATGVRVRIEPRDPRQGVASVSDPFDLVAGAPPWVELHAPSSGSVGTPVPVVFSAYGDGTVVDASIEYSVQGAAYAPATEASNARSGGTRALNATAAGVRHHFAWDFEANLGTQPVSGVKVRVTLRNAHGSGLVESVPFTVDPQRSGVPSTRNPGTTPSPPEIQMMNGTLNPSPWGSGAWSRTANQVAVRFFVGQARDERCSVLLEYRNSQGQWKPCTRAAESDDLNDLAAPYHARADYRIMWDALADLGVGSHATSLRAIPYIGTEFGQEDVTQPLQLTIPGIPAPVPITPSVPFPGMTLTKEDGDQQISIAGLTAPKVLTIRAKDSNNQNLEGVRTTFTIVQSTGPAVVLERDAVLGDTTNSDGLAGMRLRTASALADYTVTIKALVVGYAQVSTTFTVQVKRGQFVPHRNNPASVPYGVPTSLSFHLVADPAITSRLDFLPEADRPVVVTAAIVNGELLRSKISVPSGGGAPTNEFEVRLVADHLGASATGGLSTDLVQLTLSCSVTPNLIRPIPIMTPPNSRVMSGASGMTWQDVRLYLALVSGLEAPFTPQVAYGGITLVRKFRAELRDDQGAIFTQQIDPYLQYQCPPRTGSWSLNPRPIEVTWSANAGTVSGGGQSGPSITVPIATEIEFTPRGPGPWELTVSVNAVAKLALSRMWTQPSSSGPQCSRAQHGLSAATFRTVFVQRTSDIQLTDPATGQVRSEVRAGDPVRVEVRGLSSFRAAGPLERIELETARRGSGPIRTITGYPHLFRQLVDVTAFGTVLRSDSLTAVRGLPEPAPQSSHAILRDAALRLKFYDVVFSVPTERRAPERLLLPGTAASTTPDSASPQESPSGSTPTAGINGSVQLHTGEFLYPSCDLSFPTRTGKLGVCRTYRGHTRARSEERSPLGPGWFWAWDEHLEVSRDWIRWCMPDGRIVDFNGNTGEPAERGYYVRLNTSSTLDPQTSPYVIVDAQGDKRHFHVDGSLRFLQDRFDNKVTFLYNTLAQLRRVEDCIASSRYFEFDYQPPSGSTPDPLAGRLIKIRDHTQRREVAFEYYTGAHPQAGALKKVQFPSVATAQGNQLVASRRPEEYEYVPGISPAVFLMRIKDGEGKTIVLNEYQGARVWKQSHETSIRPFVFGFDLATRIAEVRDGLDKISQYQFAASPYWDGTTHLTLTIDGHPGGSRIHNRDGLLVEETRPAGDKLRIGYQEFIAGLSPSRLSPAQNRSNRLRCDEVSTTGRVRTTTYSYSIDNKVLSEIDPRGYRAGSDPLHYKVDYVWSGHQLIRVISPDVLSTHVHEIDPAIVYSRTPPPPILWHFHGRRASAYEHSADGRLKRAEDRGGVVTRYYYYPQSDWNGQGAGVSTPDGGGLLAKIVEDAEQTVERTQQLGPNVPLAARETHFKYDELGNVKESTDGRGVKREFTCNDAHELTKMALGTPPPGASPTTLRAAKREVSIWNDLRGLPVRAIQDAPAVPPGEGGGLLWKSVFDHLGLVRSVTSTVTDTEDAEETTTRDGNAEVETVQPIGFGDFGESGLTLRRDSRRRVEKVEEGGTATGVRRSQVAYSDNSEPQSLTMPGNLLHTYHLDDRGEIEGFVDPGGSGTRILRDSDGLPVREVRYLASAPNPTHVVPPPGATIASFLERRYDEHGRLRREHWSMIRPGATIPAGTGVRIRRCPEYLEPVSQDWPPVTATDLEDGNWGPCDGRLTGDQRYDTRGLPTHLTDDQGARLLLRRDGLGRVIEATWDPAQYVMKYDYDPAGNLRSTELKVRYATTTGYTTRSLTAQVEYDSLDRPWRLTDGKGKNSDLGYSARGGLASILDAGGNSAVVAPDGLGRLRTVELSVANNPYIPSGKLTHTLEYYKSDALKSFTDDNRNKIEWEYRSDGRLEAIKYPPSQANPQDSRSRMYFDPATGWVDRSEDPEGTVIKHHYAGARLERLEVTTPAAPTGTRELEFKRDGNGRVTSAKDLTSGHAVVIEYDSIDGLRSEEQGSYKVEYDREGEVRSSILKHPPAAPPFAVAYIHDRMGRLTHVRQNNRVIAQVLYRLPTQVRRKVQGTLRSDFEFDDNGNFESMTVTGIATGGDLQLVIVRDDDGRLKSVTRTHGTASDVLVWDYDEAGRVKTETRTLTIGSATETLTTTRLHDGDHVLRREQVVVVRGSTTVFDQTVERTREERGRILSETGRPALRYDKNGSLTQVGTRTYVYDSWRRLIRIEDGGQTLVSYQYDALHRLVRRTTPEGTEEYVYDGWHLIEVRRNEAAVERYVYGGSTDDLIHAEIGGQEYVVLTGPDDNPIAISDLQGAIVQFYRFDLRGRVTVLRPDQTPTSDPPRIRLLFKRRAWDPVSQLYYVRARWYSPELGIFLTADPGGPINAPDHYGFCNGDPVNNDDPFGHDESPVGQGGTRPRRRAAQNTPSPFWEGVKEFFTPSTLGGSLKAGSLALVDAVTVGAIPSVGQAKTEAQIAMGMTREQREMHNFLAEGTVIVATSATGAGVFRNLVRPKTFAQLRLLTRSQIAIQSAGYQILGAAIAPTARGVVDAALDGDGQAAQERFNLMITLLGGRPTPAGSYGRGAFLAEAAYQRGMQRAQPFGQPGSAPVDLSALLGAAPGPLNTYLRGAQPRTSGDRRDGTPRTSQSQSPIEPDNACVATAVAIVREMFTRQRQAIDAPLARRLRLTGEGTTLAQAQQELAGAASPPRLMTLAELAAQVSPTSVAIVGLRGEVSVPRQGSVETRHRVDHAIVIHNAFRNPQGQVVSFTVTDPANGQVYVVPAGELSVFLNQSGQLPAMLVRHARAR